jgi:hypothetical protein
LCAPRLSINSKGSIPLESVNSLIANVLGGTPLRGLSDCMDGISEIILCETHPDSIMKMKMNVISLLK